MKNILAILLCLFALQSSAVTYYVSFSTGSNTNNGLSPATAWKTVAKITGTNLNPGDSVLFKRGDLWDLQDEARGLEITRSGTPDNYIYFGAYGEGEKPKFRDRQDLQGWRNEANWTNMGSNKWRIDIPGMLPFTKEYRIRFWMAGQEVTCPLPPSTDVTLTEPWAADTGHIYVYSINNPAVTFSNLQKTNSSGRYGFFAAGADYLKVDGLDIGMSRAASVYIWKSDGVIIENCTIGADQCYSPIFVRGDQTTGVPAKNGIIRNNIIDSRYHIANENPYTGEDGISLHAPTDGWQVYGNVISDWCHSQIGIDYYADRRWGHTNLDIHDNELTGYNIDYGRGFHYNAGDKSFNNKMYRNWIHGAPTVNQFAAGGLEFFNNVIDSVRHPTRRGNDRSGAALAIIPYDQCAIIDLKIYNNVIANAEDAGLQMWRSTQDIDGVEIYNNIFFGNNWSAGTPNRDSDPWQLLIRDNDSLIKNLTIKNNIFYKAGSDNIIYYAPGVSSSNQRNMDVSFLNTRDGIPENKVISGNMQVDPLFTDGFRLSENSPARGGGVGGVDIGAFPYLSPDANDRSRMRTKIKVKFNNQ